MDCNEKVTINYVDTETMVVLKLKYINSIR